MEHTNKEAQEHKEYKSTATDEINLPHQHPIACQKRPPLPTIVLRQIIMFAIPIRLLCNILPVLRISHDLTTNSNDAKRLLRPCAHVLWCPLFYLHPQPVIVYAPDSPNS